MVLRVADKMALPVLLMRADDTHAGLFSLQWGSNALAPLGEKVGQKGGGYG
jgi:hypothetical protein